MSDDDAPSVKRAQGLDNDTCGGRWKDALLLGTHLGIVEDK